MAKVVGLVGTLAAVVLIALLIGGGSVEVAGLSVPAWLLAGVSYLLGIMAGWGATTGQKG